MKSSDDCSTIWLTVETIKKLKDETDKIGKPISKDIPNKKENN